MKHGRRQDISELKEELYKIINETPEDDKTEKRRNRHKFLEYVEKEPSLKFFYETIQYYLNGGPIVWSEVHKDYEDPEPDICVITSGGNIITIVSNFFRLVLQGKGEIATEYIEMLGLDIDMQAVNKAVMDVASKQSEFSRLTLKLSEALPSDLDFKISPVNIEPNAEPEEYKSQVLDTKKINFKNPSSVKSAMNNALDYLSQAAEAAEDTALLSKEALTLKIEEVSEALSGMISKRPETKIRPGPSTKHLYTQIIQENHRNKYSEKEDVEYVNFLLNEKEIIRLNTQLNSLCMASAFTLNSKAPPLITFMFAIHLISVKVNVRLNTILWNNDIEILPEQFDNISTIKNSGLLTGLNKLLIEMHNFPIFNRFMEKVDAIMNDNMFIIENPGSSWSTPELAKYIDHKEYDSVYKNNLRTTMNIVRPSSNIEKTGNKNVSELSDNGQNDASVKNQSLDDLLRAALIVDEDDTDSREGQTMIIDGGTSVSSTSKASSTSTSTSKASSTSRKKRKRQTKKEKVI